MPYLSRSGRVLRMLLLTCGLVACNMPTRQQPNSSTPTPETLTAVAVSGTERTPTPTVTGVSTAETPLESTTDATLAVLPAAVTRAPTRRVYTLTPRPSVTVQGRTSTEAGVAVSSPTPLVTLTASVSPYPTQPPQPTVSYTGDYFNRVVLDGAVVNISGAWMSFMNVNDKAPETVTPGTPIAASSVATLYIASPINPTIRHRVINLPTASSVPKIFWSPDPNYLAYYVSEANLSGIYLVDFRNAYETRFFAVDNLSPRGITSDPVWSPDGKRLIVTLTTAYDTDIFTIDVQGTNFRNLSNSGGYDFWPRWSPDGRYMAFVSDREQCPSWTPNAPNSCFRPDAVPPTGGKLYILESETGTIRKASDANIVEPPQWIRPDRIGFVTALVDAPDQTALGWVSAAGGDTSVITGTSNGVSAFDHAWSPDGNLVAYQEQNADGSAIVIRDSTGREIARTDQFTFPRYGFSAAWQPDGTRLVIGGRNGQCPYGMVILDTNLQVIYQGGQILGVCDPVWSADGKFFSFVGVRRSNSESDGRLDVYRASANGGGQQNVSGSYGGQIQFSGWVGR